MGTQMGFATGPGQELPFVTPSTSGTGADATAAQHVATPQSGEDSLCVWNVNLGLLGTHCADNLVLGGIAVLVLLIGIGGIVL